MGQVEALPWGQTVCACVYVSPCARYLVRPVSVLCVLPPGAFCTSLDALFLSPVAQSDGRTGKDKIRHRC